MAASKKLAVAIIGAGVPGLIARWRERQPSECTVTRRPSQCIATNSAT